MRDQGRRQTKVHAMDTQIFTLGYPNLRAPHRQYRASVKFHVAGRPAAASSFRQGEQPEYLN